MELLLERGVGLWARRAASLLIVAFGVMLGACARCPPEGVRELPSPDGQFVAATYVRECGPMAPFNSFVGIRGADDRAFAEVANIRDLGWQTELQWLGERELRVTFDCTAYHCGGRDDKYWEVLTKDIWGDVTVSFDATDRLRHALTPVELARLPLRD